MSGASPRLDHLRCVALPERNLRVVTEVQARGVGGIEGEPARRTDVCVRDNARQRVDERIVARQGLSDGSISAVTMKTRSFARPILATVRSGFAMRQRSKLAKLRASSARKPTP
jgi:hypothetical protein